MSLGNEQKFDLSDPTSPQLLSEGYSQLSDTKGGNSSEEFEEASSFMNYLRAFILALGGYSFGYYIGVFNPLAKPLANIVYKKETLAEENEFIGNVNLLFTLGAVLAVFISAPLSNLIGRVRLLMIGEVLVIGGGFLYTIQSVPVLLASRFLSGMIAGVNSAIVPIAMAEMFPSKISGFGGTAFYLVLTSLILIAWLFNPLCGAKDERAQCLTDHWKLILSWPAAVGVLRLFLLCIFFKFGQIESPGYYLNKIKGSDAAQKLTAPLKSWFSLVYSEECVDRKVEQTIKSALESRAKIEPTFMSMFSKLFKFRFFSVCAINLFQQLSGINFLIFYSTTLFDELSDNGAQMSLLIGGANVFGAFVGMLTVERFGRRFNLIMGVLLQAFTFCTLGIGISLGSTIIPSASVLVYTLSFAVGMGGTMPLWCAEVLPAVGVGFGCGVQWAMASVVGKFTLMVMEAIGPLGIILFFIVCNIFSFIFIDYACVESQGKSEQVIEEIYSGERKGLHRFRLFNLQV